MTTTNTQNAAERPSAAQIIAAELARIDGYDPEDQHGGLYDLRWSGGPSPEPQGNAWSMDYLPKAERIAAAIDSHHPAESVSAEQPAQALRVEYRPLLVSGMLANSPDGPTILIDSESSEQEQQRALWHEIVHMVREAQGLPQDEESVERDAQAIVAALSVDPTLPLDNVMAQVAATYPVAAIVRAIDHAAPGFKADYTKPAAVASQPSTPGAVSDEDVKQWRFALERAIESQRLLAEGIDKDNPEDPWASLLVHEDVAQLGNLATALESFAKRSATPKEDRHAQD